MVDKLRVDSNPIPRALGTTAHDRDPGLGFALAEPTRSERGPRRNIVVVRHNGGLNGQLDSYPPFQD